MTAILESLGSARVCFDDRGPLEALGAEPLFFDSRGHLHVNHEGLVYRLRFWAEEEWAWLPIESRPAACAYNPDLGIWAGLAPAPHLNN